MIVASEDSSCSQGANRDRGLGDIYQVLCPRMIIDKNAEHVGYSTKVKVALNVCIRCERLFQASKLSYEWVEIWKQPSSASRAINVMVPFKQILYSLSELSHAISSA